jgi:hypothetical protein
MEVKGRHLPTSDDLSHLCAGRFDMQGIVNDAYRLRDAAYFQRYIEREGCVGIQHDVGTLIRFKS